MDCLIKFVIRYYQLEYFISKKSGITNSNTHNFGRIRIVSYNSLPVQKIMFIM